MEYVPSWSKGHVHKRLPDPRSHDRERWHLLVADVFRVGVPVDLERVEGLERAWSKEADHRAEELRLAEDQRRLDARVREARLSTRREQDRARREGPKV